MKELIARNPKQLDICLRMLYAERVPFKVEIRETASRKIVYCITASVSNQVMDELAEKYRILIS